MAGEIITVGLSRNPFTRNAVDVQVSHSDPSSWNPPSSTLTIEYSIDGGGTWLQTGDLFASSNVCGAPIPGGFNAAPANGVTLSEYTIYAPTALLHDTSVTVRVRANTVDGDFTQAGSPVVTWDYPTFICSSTDITENGATLTLSDDSPTGQTNVAACGNDTIVWEYATTSGGPYTALPSEDVTGFSPSKAVTGLSPDTHYYWRARFSEVTDTNGQYLTTAECDFTTLAATPTTPPPAFVPTPCESCGGGAGDPTGDAEDNILCDYVDGQVVGSALAVYVYDDNGNPTGPPTLVIPGTDDPYTPQGTMMVCPGELGCLEPVEFCFVTTTTGPVDHPGRTYDLELPINPGFAVESLLVDSTTHAANIEWGIYDVDGSEFAADLQSFIDARMPAATTTTVTNPNAGSVVCGAAQPMTIHIECARIDQDPPDLVELVYNAGRDLIQNPGYNETPQADLNTDCGFHLMRRQDNANPGQAGFPPINCTNVANRGWETNDDGQTFEIWCANVRNGQQVTPTPRGTPVQEVNSDGNAALDGTTIWQTFEVPADLAGQNFRLRLVHGARDTGETHTIRLSTGDTDATGPGDLINDVTQPPSVTNSGGPNPWTTLDETRNLPAGLYTFSFHSTAPVTGARGGLFSDMRAFVDRPGARATAATDDDTCVVTVEETTTVQDAQWWSPMCNNGDIAQWKNAETGQVLSNAAFWGQVPAPTRCSDESTSGTGGSVAANLVHNYDVCATLANGEQQTLNRVVITDPSGGVLASTFVGPDGGPINPVSWTVGACSTQRFINDEILCDIAVDGTATTFIRKYVQGVNGANQGQVFGFRDFTLAGAPYVPSGTVRTCPSPADTEIVELCDVQANGVAVGFLRVFTYDEAGEVVDVENQDAAGAPYNPTGIVAPCSQVEAESLILCDESIPPVTFLRTIIRVGNAPAVVTDTELDGLTPVAPNGEPGVCGGEGGCGPITTTGVCLGDGTPIAVVAEKDCQTDDVTTVGWINLTTGTFNPGVLPAGIQSCSGALNIQNSGVLCSVDNVTGATEALVIVEYSYNPDGSIASTQLLNAVDGTPYVVPAGNTITTCGDSGISNVFGYESICYTLTSTGDTVHVGTKRHDDQLPPPGFAVFDAQGNPVNTAVDGYTQVNCNTCCPQVIATGCLSDGNHWVRIRETGGSFTVLVAETGLPANPANIVNRCPDETFQTTVTTLDNVTFGGAYSITPGIPANLQAWSVRSRSGTVTLQANGGTVVAMDVNEVISSEVSTNHPAVLSDTVNVVCDNAGDSARIIELRRI